MRGIKECTNWMLDNPMKEIEAMGLKNMRFNDVNECFQMKSNSGWGNVIYFDSLNIAEWSEVKHKYTFQQASDICRETGNRFKGEYNDMMNRNPEGEVYVWSLDGGDVVIDSEWTEV